ncbi:MAG: sterol desaturase family protein [Myxococcota bacterium]
MTPEQSAVAMSPILLAAMVAEHATLRWLGRPGYSHRRTVNNLGVMLASRAVLSAFGLVPLLGYGWMREHLGLLTWPESGPLTWAAAFVAVDFTMYWRHRAAHRVAVLWAVHAVHHQSRDYNLAVALRLSFFQDAFLIGVPLAILGLPLGPVMACWLLGNVYQFFQHTEVIPKLGWVDRWIMTPSNHRVHHGCNPRYLDKNYGNILLIWDYLFGTYVREDEPVEFGVLTGLKTYDASENGLEPFRSLLAKSRAQSTAWDAMKVLVSAPGWVPGRGEEVPALVADPEPQRNNPVSARHRAVATGLMVAAFVSTSGLTWFADRWSVVARFAALGCSVLLLAVAGVVLDNQPVEPLPADTALGAVRARLAAWVLTLAGPDAEGPLKRLGRALRGSDR